jgi:hypothetical protein
VVVTGQQFDGYHTYLNEARLSALAICFYLASIKINPMSDEYKVLFLDDVFIGLDTSNRLPLLEILHEEFPDFQTFIATYDRNWFETAKHWFNEYMPTKWLQLELFTDNRTGFEKPMVFKGRTGLEKAQEYFVKKDYPAAANALRSHCEEIIKKILPIDYKYESDPDTGRTRPIVKAETLYSNLVRFMDYVGANSSFIRNFRFFQKNIFNPLSHGDIIVPHYQMEIEKAIEFTIKLEKIQSKIIVSPEPDTFSTLKLDIKNNVTQVLNHYEFFCLDPMYAMKVEDDPVNISDPRCHVYHREENKKYYCNEPKEQTVFGCIKQILHFQQYSKEYSFDAIHALEFRSGKSLASKLKFE